MEQRKTISEDQSGVALPAPPPWMRRATPYAPDRRAQMLEHMARARSQSQAIAAPPPAQPPLATVAAILGDAFGYAVLFGIMALLFQSQVPLYVGAFLFLAYGPRIESALGAIGIRFESDAIGPGLIKGSVFWLTWIAMLVSIRGSVPAWLASWMPPTLSWSAIAGIALGLAIFDALAALTLRRAGPRFGLAISPDSLIWTMVKVVIVVGVLALLALLGAA
ncbi:hypothetical protein [Bradyrhizobium sp. 1(2017)]|uniref:hypothetical protein n=1 Tax=Bradyrhizobium sp. 1(2017) TaxID=1404888 RepID=UPI00140F0E23|nr:hypothetical protein [Bradyrhizobium sp. 1(2017)]QIO34162.1 hypothetical protein HAP40_21390 [Bradyrhizobium sp. 1(2017)]